MVGGTVGGSRAGEAVAREAVALHCYSPAAVGKWRVVGGTVGGSYWAVWWEAVAGHPLHCCCPARAPSCLGRARAAVLTVPLNDVPWA